MTYISKVQAGRINPNKKLIVVALVWSSFSFLQLLISLKYSNPCPFILNLLTDDSDLCSSVTVGSDYMMEWPDRGVTSGIKISTVMPNMWAAMSTFQVKARMYDCHQRICHSEHLKTER